MRPHYRAVAGSVSRVSEPPSLLTRGAAASSAALIRPSLAAPPGMAGSDDDGEPVMADDPAAQPGRPPRSLDEAEIRGPLGDVADDRLGVDRGQYDIGGRAARSQQALGKLDELLLDRGRA